jgi:hypothetical protein
MHVLLQYDKNLTGNEIAKLKDKGVEITSPVSTKTYIASIPTKSQNLEEILKMDNHNPRYVGEFKKEDKMGRIWDKNQSGQVKGLHVVFHKDVDYIKAKTTLEGMGLIIESTLKEANSFGVRAADNAWDANLKLAEKVAELDGVYAVGQAMPLSKFEKQNMDSRSAGGVKKVQRAHPRLDGSGVTVLVYDGGYADDNHPDLKGRTTIIEDVSYWYADYHPTHVACTVGGDGTNSLKFLKETCEPDEYDYTYIPEAFETICEEYMKALEAGDTSKFDKIFRGMIPTRCSRRT